jgi:hypothetical protein
MVFVSFFTANISAQEQDPVRSLIKKPVSVSELWVPEVKVNSIQGTVSTLIGGYGGALFNRSFLLGIAGGANLSHPSVNYGYFGAIAQYIVRPSEMVHFSGQLVLAQGSTKDYENPKNGLLENFMNISGARFFMTEPGVNIELNISQKVALVAGVSYRFVTGINEENKNIQITKLTNKDLSGINFSFGVKFWKEKKSEKN